ncbi:MAG: hypothetical protein WB919_01310 [Candidatus Sulfotelmatobacter sp.]
MNRKVYASILALCACLATGFLVGCGGSSSKTTTTTTTTTPTIAIAATSGGGQSAPVSTAFGSALSATVTSNGTAASGVSVTFTAPSSGASGTFADNGTPAATDVETTNSSGVATSTTFTANATAGAYAITASATGATSSASFSMTNTAAVATNNTYVYYVSGQESSSSGPGHYYAIAGAVTLDSTGDIIGGEQDYNDGVGITSPGEPTAPDTITPAAGALVVDPTTGLGTLTMTSSNTSVGASGKETFDVQFVNANHALIVQADGSATSSGSLDLQTATTTTGNFAFAISGVNPITDSVAYGGVFTTGATGTIDINDADGGISQINPFTPSSTTPDAFGRSVVTGISNLPYAALGVNNAPANVTFVSYAVGPEAMRFIDVDTTDSAVGSAFGQGAATFTNTSLTSAVFTLFGQVSEPYATLGQFTTDTNGDGGIATGAADDNELYNGVQVENTLLTGSTYDLASSGINGYGSMSLNFGTSAADVSSIGLYMTDPALNLNDPNNTTTDVGGALLVDMDPGLPGGIGVVTPQTDTTATDFNGSYAAGFQDFNSFGACDGCEFDMVGPFTVTAGALSTASIGADGSDPLDTLTSTETTGDIYTSIPLSVSAGYFSMSSANLPAPGNPLVGVLNAAAVTQDFDADIYQASATTLYWLNFDTNSVFLGAIEAQPSGTTFPATKKRAGRAQAKRRQ